MRCRSARRTASGPAPARERATAGGPSRGRSGAGGRVCHLLEDEGAKLGQELGQAGCGGAQRLGSPVTQGAGQRGAGPEVETVSTSGPDFQTAGTVKSPGRDRSSS